MSEPTKLEILPYAERFAIPPQLASLMKLLHDASPLATNEEIKEVLLAYGRKHANQKRIVDMSIYRLRKSLAPYDIEIKRIENFGAYFTEEDKRRISYALNANQRVQSA